MYPDLKMRVGYSYDLAGRMSGMSYPGGETVRYERDRTEMGYDLLGRQVNQRWPNGLSETRTYDSASRLLAITPGQQDKKGAPTITYAYDQRGNRLTMDRSDVGLSSYTYDEISQLLTATLPDGDFQTYTFDAVGNRLSLRDRRGLQAYEYDEADELLEVESDFNPEEPSMKGSLLARLGASDANKPLFRTAYGWDADGNQVSKTGPGHRSSRYSFDALDRLAGASAPGSEPVTYLYNVEGKRIATILGNAGDTDYCLYGTCGWMQYVEFDSRGNIDARNTVMPEGTLIARLGNSDKEPIYYHFDSLGDTVAMSTGKGFITNLVYYEPYGGQGMLPPERDGFTFVGQEGVAYSPTGLFRMGLREYDASTGRFLSVDPLWTYGMGGLLLENRLLSGLRKYVYSGNNPVRYVDPSGLQCGPGSAEGIVPDSFDGVFNFSGACNAHDRCYSTPGKTKEECDNAFLSNMRSSCVGMLSETACRALANTYYYGVKNAFADNGYRNGQNEGACGAAGRAPAVSGPYTSFPGGGLW